MEKVKCQVKISLGRMSPYSCQKDSKKIDFFFKQQQPPVEKIECPACKSQVIRGKLNYHLDNECTSIADDKPKTKKSRKAMKNKSKKHEVKKNRTRALLSDSEDDDVVCLSVVASPSQSQVDPSSYVEAVLDETDLAHEDDNVVSLSPKVNSGSKISHEGVSPYFSESKISSGLKTAKNVCRIINFELPQRKVENLQTRQMLEEDWLSPTSSPMKEDQGHFSESHFAKDLSPEVEPNREVLDMLTQDWESDASKSSGATPVKVSFLKDSDKRSSTDLENRENTELRSNKSNKGAVLHDGEGEQNWQVTQAPSTSQTSSEFVSPHIENDPVSKKIGDSDSECSVFNTPLKRSVLLSPNRTPSPSPTRNDSSCSQTVSPTKSQMISANRLSPSSPSSKISPRMHIHRKGFNPTSPSGSNSSAGSSPGSGNKMQNWTPRKVSQALKHTALLQNSSQIPQIMSKAKRKISLSPTKSPGKIVESVENSRPDPAQFRGHLGYYLSNFLHIVDSVTAQPQDMGLFNDDDIAHIETFRGMSLEARKLYVRLFQRKIKWNRVSKIEYKEICDPADTKIYVSELTYAGFLHSEEDLSELSDILNLLSAAELQKLCRQMKVGTAGKREDMIGALIKFTMQQRTISFTFKKTDGANSLLAKRGKEIIGKCCLVNKEVRKVFMRIIMLYSLPRYDDEEDGGAQSRLTTLLMVNLGRMSFPTYEVIREKAIFRSRDDIVRFETCSQLENDMREFVEAHKWEEALQIYKVAKETYEELLQDEELIVHDQSLPTFLRRFTSMSTLVYILTCGVEVQQRCKSYKEAVIQLRELLDQKLYLQDYKGRWYDRLALNLDTHLKRHAEAVDVIEKAIYDHHVRKGHYLSLCQRAHRMAAASRYSKFASRLEDLPIVLPREAPKVIIEGRCLPSDIPGYKRAFIQGDSSYHSGLGDVTLCSVEEFAISHYRAEGYSEGLHREGTTISSLFGLFLWDILYAPIPDAFRSPHQAAPLDLDDPHFYEARKDMITKRLTEMKSWSDEEAELELESTWSQHIGKVCMVAWDLFRSVDHAKGLVRSIGMSGLAALCERLAKDHRFSRSGFPDLIVWDPQNKRCRIVEVKGPNDRLSTKQILWLEYIVEAGIPAEVCHVEEIGAKRIKKSSPKKISPKKKSPKKASTKKVERELVEGAAKKGGKRKKKKAQDSEDEFKPKSKRKPSAGGSNKKATRSLSSEDEFEEGPAVKRTARKS